MANIIQCVYLDRTYHKLIIDFQILVERHKLFFIEIMISVDDRWGTENWFGFVCQHIPNHMIELTKMGWKICHQDVSFDSVGSVDMIFVCLLINCCI